MNPNDFSSAPPILDFEASSLSDCSNPISMGLVVAGKVHYWLIKPEPNWIDWDLQSQAIHGLSRSFIVENGLPANQVYREASRVLNEIKIVYSDCPSAEKMWLSRLGSFDIDIRHINELLTPENQEEFKTHLMNTFNTHNLTRHRADHDALALAITLQQLI